MEFLDKYDAEAQELQDALTAADPKRKWNVEGSLSTMANVYGFDFLYACGKERELAGFITRFMVPRYRKPIPEQAAELVGIADGTTPTLECHEMGHFYWND